MVAALTGNRLVSDRTRLLQEWKCKQKRTRWQQSPALPVPVIWHRAYLPAKPVPEEKKKAGKIVVVVRAVERAVKE